MDAEADFEHWLLKFDGDSNNGDRELADPMGFGKVEFAYALMVRAAGITMAECCLHHEGDHSHFMTWRLDRDSSGRKVHILSLGGMRHFEFNDPSANSYEEAVIIIRAPGFGMVEVEEPFRRAVFDVLARNRDDHVKNISFLMDRNGGWSLSPTHDVTFAWISGLMRLTDEVVAVGCRIAGRDLRPSGTMRITTTDTLLFGWLSLSLREIRSAHSGIRLELAVSNDVVSLSRREAEIAGAADGEAG